MYKNLKITAYLSSAVISDVHLPLDGIVLSLVMREKYGNEIVTFSNKLSNDIDVEIPFKKHFFEDGNWCYKCSFAEWNGIAKEEKSYFAKRFNAYRSDMIEFGKNKAQVEIAKGKYKNMFIEVYQRHAISVSWYCVGNKEKLEKLLPFCTNLGKKASQGNGSVLRFEIKEIENDYSIYKDLKLMRSIPNQNGIVYGLRPPYWLSDNQFLVELPK